MTYKFNTGNLAWLETSEACYICQITWITKLHPEFNSSATELYIYELDNTIWIKYP